MGVVVPMLATKKLLPLVGSRQRLTTSLIRRSFAGRFFLLAAVLGELENGFDRLQLGEQFTETMIDWDEVIFVHLGAIFSGIAHSTMLTISLSLNLDSVVPFGYHGRSLLRRPMAEIVCLMERFEGFFITLAIHSF